MEPTCAATAETPTNTTPTAAIDSPNATLPPTGDPEAASAVAAIAAVSTTPVVAKAIAAHSPARRPIAVEPTSSVRPVFSSARVCRTTVSSAARGTSVNRIPERQVTSAPRSSPKIGPTNASSAGVCAVAS
nr:hypothetical protein [Rhodococcus sp. 06-1059B-a]